MRNQVPLFLFLTVLFAGSCSSSSTEDTALLVVDLPGIACIDGMAGGQFPCKNVRLMAHLDKTALGIATGNLNDIWGWTDPQTQKMYALVGSFDRVTIVDITEPADPVVTGFLPEPESTTRSKGEAIAGSTPLNSGCWFTGSLASMNGETGLGNKGSAWRDIKVYNDHMFVVSDGQQNHGMQVFDLTQLRNVSSSTPVTFQATAIYNEFDRAHNIVINEDTGFAYAVGVTQGQQCATGGLHMINIQDPANPVFAGCYLDPNPKTATFTPAGYIHDAQCLLYDGPDADHQGKELCFNAAEGALAVSDVTDKSNPFTLSFIENPLIRYAHQGWLTPDRRFFLMNDELDEQNFGTPTRTFIWNVENLDEPSFVGVYEHSTGSIDHNLYTKDRFAFEANYTSGLRILDISGASSGSLNEVAFFDTFPLHNGPGFSGAWSNYPFFENGIVIVSDISNGLFVLLPELN